MPIYEYECPQCGKVFEEWGKASDSHKEVPCPQCGTPSPRIMSRTSFVLKGDGWYVSDYGYRKGISEDSGGKADTPVPATPTKPAKQGEKALAKVPEKKAEAKKATDTSPGAKAETAATSAVAGASSAPAASSSAPATSSRSPVAS